VQKTIDASNGLLAMAAPPPRTPLAELQQPPPPRSPPRSAVCDPSTAETARHISHFPELSIAERPILDAELRASLRRTFDEGRLFAEKQLGERHRLALSITEDKLASEVCAQKMKVEIVNHALQVELESMEEMMEDMSEISLRACKSSNALVQSLESENEELREQLRVMTEERDRLRRYTAEDEKRLEKLESIYGPFGDEWYVSSSDDEGVLV